MQPARRLAAAEKPGQKIEIGEKIAMPDKSSTIRQPAVTQWFSG